MCCCHSSHLSDSNVISSNVRGCCVIHVELDCGETAQNSGRTRAVQQTHTHTHNKNSKKEEGVGRGGGGSLGTAAQLLNSKRNKAV